MMIEKEEDEGFQASNGVAIASDRLDNINEIDIGIEGPTWIKDEDYENDIGQEMDLDRRERSTLGRLNPLIKSTLATLF